MASNEPYRLEATMNNTIAKAKSKIKRHAPELAIGSIGCALLVGALIFQQKKVGSYKINLPKIDPDSILVLEQVTVDTYKDLDFGDMFRVTPINQ